MYILFVKSFGVGWVMGQRYQNVRKIPTALIRSLHYEIIAYLYIEHKIAGFAKLMDMGGNGKSSTKKSGYGWIWIWPNGVEWSVL